MKDAFSVLNQLNVKMVLDAATGRGDFIHVLKQNLKSYVQIIGVDASEKSVDQAQKFFPENDVEIFHMDLEQLDYEDSFFDLISLSNSLHHLEHMDKVIAELLRVLVPGGTLLILEPYSDGKQSEAQQTHIMLHHWLSSIDRKFGVHHRETYTKQEITDLVHTFKLNKIEITDFYEPVDNPKEAKTCDNLKRNCLDTLKRLESDEENQALLHEGKVLMERITNVGCAGSSKLLIIGKKPKPRK